MDVEREGGRRANQLRPMDCSRNVLNRAHGSASCSLGETKVVAAVFGPKAGTKKNENPEKACIEIIWKPKTGQIVQWWEYIGDGVPELKSFAIKVLGLTCSSSACERNWSTFNQVHTKRRNCLGTMRMNKLVYIMFNKKLKFKHLKKQARKEQEDPLVVEDVESDDEWLVDSNQQNEAIQMDYLLGSTSRKRKSDQVSNKGKPEKEFEMILKRTLQNICLLKVHPNTTTSIILQVAHDDGSLLPCAIHATCAALVDAGFPLKSLAVAICCCLTDSGHIILDPSKIEEQKMKANVCLVFPSSVNSVVPEGSTDASAKSTEQGLITSLTHGVMAVDEFFDSGRAAVIPLSNILKKKMQSQSASNLSKAG